jgi:cysteine synthase A
MASRPGLLAAVGNTPLIELKTLSALTGCTILAKCEHLNPGGSVKDRAALWMVEEAERTGKLQPGGTIFEGTGGNTGIGLAMVAAAKGYKSCFAMSATLAPEKIACMTRFGAKVMLCKGNFRTPTHYFHAARKAAEECKGGFWANQFDNLANRQSHIDGTGPEIWRQTDGKVDGFVCSCGTGGTLSGVSEYLKSQNENVTCALIDCEGSGLFDFVGNRQVPEPEDIHGYATKIIPVSAGNSISEGIGINRLTDNFLKAQIDTAFVGTDNEALQIAYYLLQHEGLFIGPSAALNVVGAIKLARHLGPGKTIVTIICDGGDRYLSKLYSPEWLATRELTVPTGINSAADLVIS